MSSAGVINIRGKQYQTVAYRLHIFRQAHPDWTVNTVVIENTDTRVVMRAEIADEEGRLRAAAYSEEFRKDGNKVNITSAMENAETSAVGRAMAFLGLAGDNAIASAEEVMAAQAAQKRMEAGNQ